MKIQVANIPQEARPFRNLSAELTSLIEPKVNERTVEAPVPKGAKEHQNTEKAVLAALPVVGSFFPLFECINQNSWKALGLSAGTAFMNATSSMGLIYGIATGDAVVTGASLATLGATGYVGSLV